MDVGKARLPKCRQRQIPAYTVQCRIGDPELARHTEGRQQPSDGLKITALEGIPEPLQSTVGPGCFMIDPREPSRRFDVGDGLSDAVIVGWRDLCAIVPKHLAAVVSRRVVARGQYDTCGGPRRAYREGDQRGGCESIEEMDAKALTQGHTRGFLGKSQAVLARVIAYTQPPGGRIGNLGP
jgi:hypothetical protein